MSRLANRRVLITGAAHGMGRLMARRMAAEGAHVLLADIDAESIRALADDLVDAEAFVCDVSDRRSVENLRDEVGAVDILINNAGIISTGSYGDIPAESDERMLGVNVVGAHWITKYFLPRLIDSDEGHLVMMASVASIVGVPYQALYSASKWFVAGLGESIRQEIRAEGHDHLRVTIVQPSIVDTGFYAAAKAPHLIPILQPKRVVDRIVVGIRKNRPYVREPFMVKLAPMLHGLLPSRLSDAVSALLGTGRVVPREPR